MKPTYSHTVNPQAVSVLAPLLRAAPNFEPSNFASIFGWRVLGAAPVGSGHIKMLLEAPGGLALADVQKCGPDSYWAFILSSAADAAPIDRMNQDGDPFAR